MSGLELSVVGIGLFVGFIAVSALWPSKAQQKASQAGQADGEPQAGQTKQQSQNETWYEVLQVSPSATQDQVKEAYKRLMSQYHPDKVAALGAELQRVATEMSKKINAAYKEGLERTSGR